LQAFEKGYAALFGRTVEGMDIEITVWSVNATTPVDDTEPSVDVAATDQATIAAQREMYDAQREQMATASVVSRDQLQDGQFIEGPAAIVEDETTIIVPRNRTALLQADGCIDVRLSKL